MQLIPNDLERDGWIEVGHGLKALCADDEDGFSVFDAWSQAHVSYDTTKTRTAWDSFGARGLRTHGGKLRARAEELDREGFTAWDAALVFDDGAEPPQSLSPERGSRQHPFKWMDLSKTNPRDWLYGDILLRKFISMTVAPGGVGKSSLVAVETLAQVTGRNLLGMILQGRSGCGCGTWRIHTRRRRRRYWQPPSTTGFRKQRLEIGYLWIAAGIRNWWWL